MKKLIIVPIILLSALGLFCYYFTGTPTYSLYQLRRAIRNHDSASFNQYVDVGRVADSLMEEMSRSVEEEMGADNSLGEFGMGLINAMMPTIKEAMKQGINRSIEEISEDKQESSGKVKIKEIKKEGKAAEAILTSANDEEIRLNMIKTSKRRWQVVGIGFDDFKKLNPEAADAQKIKEEEEKKKQEEEQAKYENLRSKISVEVLEKGFLESDFMSGIYSDYIILKLKLTNNSGKNIKGFQGELKFLDMFDDEIATNSLKYEDGINSGETKEWPIQKIYNAFMDEEKALKETELDKLQYKWLPSTIIYEDGSREEVEANKEG